MSTFISQSPGLSAPVSQGALVTQTVFSTGGFDAGEYVYLTRGAYEKQATVGLGSGGGVVAGTVLNNGLVSAFAPAFLQGPTAVSGTYTGSTINIGTQRTAAVNDGTSTEAYQLKALLGGNYVVARQNSNTLTFTIVTVAGAVVTSSTTVTSSLSTNEGSFAIAARADGGFTIFYSTTGNTNLFTGYSATGAQVYTGAFSTGMHYRMTACGLSGGGCTLVMLDANNSFRYAVIGPTGAILRNIDGPPNGTAGGASAPSVDALTAASGGGYVMAWYSGNADESRWASLPENGNTSPLGGGTIVPRTGQQLIIALSDGGFVYANNNGGSVFANRYTRAGVNSFSLQSSNTQIPSLTAASNRMAGAALANGAYFVATYQAADSSPGYVVQTSSTPNSPAFSSRVSVGPANAAFGASSQFATAGGDGTAFYGYKTASGAGNVFLTAYYTGGPLTNGSTVTGSPITYPTNVFAGVSLTSAPANGTGQIATNGVAQLNSNYQQLSSSVSFDLTSSGSPVANKGVAVGRTVILKGNE